MAATDEPQTEVLEEPTRQLDEREEPTRPVDELGAETDERARELDGLRAGVDELRAGVEVVRAEVAETARAAVDLWARAAAWGLGTSVRVGARIAGVAAEPETAIATLYSDVAGGLRAYAREFLGISDLDARIRELTPLAGSLAWPARGEDGEADLRARGAELLRQAADVGFDESAHPAYARILTELAPDEARILRVLVEQGPQPVVDVRAGHLIGLGSQLVAQSLNMLGADAGLRRRDRVPAYLNNLSRLGLILFSDEPVGGPAAYQVLEAQPDVLGVLKETSRAKTVHRSIQLSPFGLDFCEVCLPLEPPGLMPPASD